MVTNPRNLTIQTAQLAHFGRAEEFEPGSPVRTSHARTVQYVRSGAASIVDVVDKKALKTTPWPASPRLQSPEQRVFVGRHGNRVYADTVPLPEEWAEKLAAFNNG